MTQPDEKPLPQPRVWNARDLADVKAVQWLAKGRLPRGAVSILVGDEGIGKSLLWVWIVAAVTTGRALPEFGIPARPAGHVLLVLTEDDWSSTVRPRLEVAGADLANIAVICEEKDGSGSPVFPRDMYLVESCPVALVVVDAFLDTVAPGLSMKDPQQARQALHPWREAALTTGSAVLLLTHTNRLDSKNPRDKYGISGELRKKARMTLYAQRDDEDRLVVGPEKSNIVGAVPASMFTIEPVRVFAPTDDTDGTVPRLRFAGESEKTAREIVADLVDAQRGDEDREDRTEAEKWLEGYLAEHGESPSAEVKKAGSKALGVTDRTIKRAARSLKVEMRYVGRPPVTYWSLDPSSRDTGDPCMSEDVPTCPTYSDLRKRDVPTRADSELGHEDTHRVPTVPTSDSGATRDPCMSESGPTGPTGRDLHKQNGPTGADSQSGHAQTHSGPAGPTGVVVDLDTRRETHEVPSSTPSPAPRKNTPRTPPKWTDPQWGTVYLGTDGKAAPLERFSEWRLAGSPAIRVPEGVAS